MPSSLRKSDFRIVPRRRPVEIDPALFRRAKSQPSLFEDEEPWLVVFASVPDLPGDTLIELIRCAEPGVVYDLRLVPRFDLGSLNREKAFMLFDYVNATYVDTTTSIMAGMDKMHAVELLVQRLASDVADARRPVVFLLGRDESSLASQNDLMGILTQVGRPVDFVSIPSD